MFIRSHSSESSLICWTKSPSPRFLETRQRFSNGRIEIVIGRSRLPNRKSFTFWKRFSGQDYLRIPRPDPRRSAKSALSVGFHVVPLSSSFEKFFYLCLFLSALGHTYPAPSKSWNLANMPRSLSRASGTAV